MDGEEGRASMRIRLKKVTRKELDGAARTST